MIGTVAIVACAQGSVGSGTPAVVRGTLRFVEGQVGDTAIGPVVVILEPTDPGAVGIRPAQLFEITSTTDRFDPGFTAVGDGDYIVFVNDGAISHRLFSADIGSDIQIPVRPGSSSEPHLIDRTGELRFFCSLHPDENFSVLATDDAFFAVLDENGEYFVGPLPGGSYRLSIWSPRLKGPVRTVEVESGRTVVETIWLDPDLIGR